MHTKYRFEKAAPDRSKATKKREGVLVKPIGQLMGTDKDRDLLILDAMARAFFVTAWADYEEETGWPSGSPSGMDLMDIAPDTEEEAEEEAVKLYDEIESLNNIDLGEFVDSHDWPAQEFGHYLAMEAMGTGVGWADSWPEHGLEIPYGEFSWLNLDPAKYPDIEREESVSPLMGALRAIGQQAQPTSVPEKPQPVPQEKDKSPAQDEIRFRDMFSKDVASWIAMEARILATNNYGDWKNMDEANDKIDKAVEEVSEVLSKAGRTEAERIVNEERQEILEEMSSYIPIQEVPDVQQPTMGPVERPVFPDEPQQQQVGPMGAALRSLKRAPISAMLKKAFEKAPKHATDKKAWGEGGNWETGEAERWILNDEGLYHDVASILANFPINTESTVLAEELQSSFLSEMLSSYMDPKDVRNIDWQELAKELKGSMEDSFEESFDDLDDDRAWYDKPELDEMGISGPPTTDAPGWRRGRTD